MTEASTTTTGPILILGGGHAAAALCAALVEAGQGARIHLVCAEPQRPYQRPPLSKAFLKNPDEQPADHRPEAWYADAGIQVHLGDPAVAVDRAERIVTLQSGTVLGYEQLVFATGTRARRLPSLPEGLENVVVLRSAADAQALRERLATATSLTVLGGGFIGLEVAATARARGLTVQVLESSPRLMLRSVSAEVSQHVEAQHRAAGVDVRCGVRVGGFDTEGGRLTSLQVDGVAQPVDLLLLGIGAEPETTLAEAAGLVVENGIVVDAQLQTSDPAVLAIGDCARFPDPVSGETMRLESVQNANDQARTAAARLLGGQARHAALPWFWSEQGAMRLQMAGLLPAEGTTHRRPGATPASFSLFHYVGERLVCVESVNAPMDHLMSRKLMEAGKHPAPAVVTDPAVALKSLA